ncbi:hypothetical protein Slin15195_G118040 [Septoria linicola]|uniref:Uncharacterized protein n=1 Tax=Septoria linicola TaxID=215465 RepID=A0A9Q9EPV7_9PEZI|nr:hypothetical protein Slin14017_G095040 [Septoria linicola]USW58485.1 hypothetical protein Slin15195_G118040 [Septoria linicola]
MGSLPPHANNHNHNNNNNNNNSYHNSYFHPYSNHGPNAHGSGNSSTRPFVDSAMESDHPPAAPVGVSVSDPSFDILDWHPAYLSCQRYFIDHAQYEPGTQAVCALINIRLPHQWLDTPVTSSTAAAPGVAGQHSFNFNAYSRGGSSVNSPRSRDRSRDQTSSNNSGAAQVHVSPIPYIRRLVVTGFDKAAILHGFFGDDYQHGISPHVECERRNYLFAAKHGGWRSCKKQYDSGSGHGGDETVPFMKPLDETKSEELAAAEKQWSDWLAMEDWMVGPRAPEGQEGRSFEDQERRSGGNRSRGGLIGHSQGLPDGLPDGIRDDYRSR